MLGFVLTFQSSNPEVPIRSCVGMRARDFFGLFGYAKSPKFHSNITLAQQTRRTYFLADAEVRTKPNIETRGFAESPPHRRMATETFRPCVALSPRLVVHNLFFLPIYKQPLCHAVFNEAPPTTRARYTMRTRRAGWPVTRIKTMCPMQECGRRPHARRPPSPPSPHLPPPGGPRGNSLGIASSARR